MLADACAKPDGSDDAPKRVVAMSVSAGGPEANETQRDRIVFWHARAHDKLDSYGIPRFDGDGRYGEYMLEERIQMLAENGPSEPPERGQIHAALNRCAKTEASSPWMIPSGPVWGHDPLIGGGLMFPDDDRRSARAGETRREVFEGLR